MSQNLKNKRVIVTGGASGIGRRTAELFCAAGAEIAILDVDGTAAGELANRLREKGHAAHAFAANVADEADVEKAVAAATVAMGGIDILLNIAGIADFAPLEGTTLASWNRLFAVNVTGTFLMSKAVLPALLEQGGGAIVNIASVAGINGIPNMFAYCASKAAVVGMTKQMAVDYAGRGIRVNCVCPGTTADTGMATQIDSLDGTPEAQARRVAKYPIGRFGRPDEIGQAILFLASDEASFLAGVILPVDGGMSAL
jgi:NAD(P)-dependent dehydrogenase (short-subunit alcohol dehydrogenase family)